MPTTRRAFLRSIAGVLGATFIEPVAQAIVRKPGLYMSEVPAADDPPIEPIDTYRIALAGDITMIVIDMSADRSARVELFARHRAYHLHGWSSFVDVNHAIVEQVESRGMALICSGGFDLSYLDTRQSNVTAFMPFDFGVITEMEPVTIHLRAVQDCKIGLAMCGQGLDPRNFYLPGAPTQS